MGVKLIPEGDIWSREGEREGEKVRMGANQRV